MKKTKYILLIFVLTFFLGFNVVNAGCYSCQSIPNPNDSTRKSFYKYYDDENGGTIPSTCKFIDNSNLEQCDAKNNSDGGSSGSQNPSGDSGYKIKDFENIAPFADAMGAPTKYTENDFCSEMKICYQGFSDYKCLANYNAKMYVATSHCVDDSSTQYNAYCIDPAVWGPDKLGANGCLEYRVDERLDLKTDFGKAIYYLYTKYGNSEFGVIQDVARLLVAHIDDDYEFLGLNGGPWARYAQAYHNSTGSGTVAAIYNDVMNNYKSVKEESTELNLSTVSSNVNTSNNTFNIKLRAQIMNSNISLDSFKNGNNLIITATDNKGNAVDISSGTKITWSSEGKNIVATIDITGPLSNLCNLNVKAHLTYNDPNDVRNVFIARAKRNNMVQRFLVLNNRGSGNKIDIIKTANINLSENPSCQPPTTVDDVCRPTVDFKCDKGDNTYSIVEGKNNGTGAVDWEKCIVNYNDDTNENPYKIQEQLSNGYCEVYCKEDYSFRLPGILDNVAAGRYLSINVDKQYHAVVGVSAQRTCVSTNIKVNEYLNNAKTLKQDMLKQLNIYEYYKGMLNRLEKTENGLEQIDFEKYYTKKDDEMGAIHTNRYYTTHDLENNISQDLPDFKWGSVSNADEFYLNSFDFDFKYDKYKFTTTSANPLDIVKAKIVIDKEKIDANSSQGIDNLGDGVIPSNEEPSEKQSFQYDKCNSNIRPCLSHSRATAYYVGHYGTKERAEENYNATKNRIKSIMDNAKAEYNADRSELFNITSEINLCTTWELDYKFDPEITFTYDESSYIEMMNGNTTLEKIGDVQVNSSSYYCNSAGTMQDTFNCGGAGNKIDAIIPNSNIDAATGSSTIVFYNNARIGKIDKYGDTGVSINSGKESFIYFRSRVPFYTNGNKGIVTASSIAKDEFNANKSSGNGEYTILDIDDPNRGSNEPDGLVYPIALSTPSGIYEYSLRFANIGQYNNSSRNLGRIMGQNGYISKELKDSYYCTYTVSDSNNSCDVILKNDESCKNNPNSDACLNKLLDEKCCDYIDFNAVTPGVIDKYNAMCTAKTCSNFKILSNEEDTKEISASSLQLYVRPVSLNNLFPNGEASKGYNWRGVTSGNEKIVNGNKTPQNLSDVIANIEREGESIYSQPSCSIKLTPTCMAKVREYNHDAESSSNGFNDYNLEKNNYSRDDNNDAFFKYLNDIGCANDCISE